MLCSELESPAVLPLLMPTPNGQQNLGSNRDRFILQPASTSAELLQWCETPWEMAGRWRGDGGEMAGSLRGDGGEMAGRWRGYTPTVVRYAMAHSY